MIDFTRLDLTIPSDASERLLECMLSNSPLEGLGPTFLKMESIYQVNALYLCAHAILECIVGKKQNIQFTKNIYNIRYKRPDGMKEIVVFDNLKQCVETMAKLISTVYFSKEKEKNLNCIAKYFAPNNSKRWIQDINAIMNKMIVYHDSLRQTNNH